MREPRRTALAVPQCAPPAPVPPPDLARKIEAFDGMELVRGQVPAAIVAEAKSHLAVLETYHAPPVPEQIELWLRKLRSGVVAVGEAEFDGRLEAITEACGHLPAWIWNMETLKEAWRTVKFFPTPAELDPMLQTIASKRMRGISHVRLLAEARPAAPEEPVRSIPDGAKPAAVVRRLRE